MMNILVLFLSLNNTINTKINRDTTCKVIKLDTPGKSPLIKNIQLIQQNGGRVNWSPSGNNLIVFDRKNTDGYYDVYVMTTEGKIINSLTDKNLNINQKHNGDPVWHPSGKYIVFKSEEVNHYARHNKWFSDPGIGLFSNLWVTTLSGKQFRKLTNIPIKQTLWDGIPAIGVLFPRFSHNGSKLAWSERYDKCQCKKRQKCRWGKWRIKTAEFIADEDGPYLTNETIVFQPEKGCYVNVMAFSRDDKQLLLAGNLEGQDEYGMDLYTFDLKSGQLKNLTNTPYIWEEGSCWSPDGKYIVYMTNIGSPTDFNKVWTKQRITREYWIMDADGTRKRQLTYFNDPKAPEYVGRPVAVGQCSFSPDGKYLIGIFTVDYGNKKRPDVRLKIVKIEFNDSL